MAALVILRSLLRRTVCDLWIIILHSEANLRSRYQRTLFVGISATHHGREFGIRIIVRRVDFGIRANGPFRVSILDEINWIIVGRRGDDRKPGSAQRLYGPQITGRYLSSAREDFQSRHVIVSSGRGAQDLRKLASS